MELSCTNGRGLDLFQRLTQWGGLKEKPRIITTVARQKLKIKLNLAVVARFEGGATPR